MHLVPGMHTFHGDARGSQALGVRDPIVAQGIELGGEQPASAKVGQILRRERDEGGLLRRRAGGPQWPKGGRGCSRSRARCSVAASEPAAADGKALDGELHAVIPGGLGRRFKSFARATDLKNQAVDTDVAAVSSPNSWKPGTQEDRGRRHGSGHCAPGVVLLHRRALIRRRQSPCGLQREVNTGDIGALANKGTTFTHSCGASHRVQTTDARWFASKGETLSRASIPSWSSRSSRTHPGKRTYRRRSSTACSRSTSCS